MIFSALIALRDKSVSLVWLTLLVVIAEFLIVIARFIYGYEQTFMGDLVRFGTRHSSCLPQPIP
jgi:hypothetical protein